MDSNQQVTAGSIPWFLVAALIASACDAPEEERVSVAPGTLQETIGVSARLSFDDAFHPVKKVIPEQPGEAPIVRISDIDFDTTGSFLIADRSEGNIKVFSPDGTRIGMMGRLGGGPGEFRDAGHAAFGPDGHVHAVDPANQRISVFSREGALLNDVPYITPTGTGITTFDVLPDTTYLIGHVLRNSPPDSGQYLLHRVSSSGQVIQQFVKVGALRPPNSEPSEYWSYFQHVRFARAGSNVVVLVPVADTLWTANLESGEVTRTALNFEGYEAMRPPARGQSFREWLTQVQRGTTPHLNRTGLVITFVNGVLHYGDPAIRLGLAGGHWYVVSGGPPVIAHTQDLFVALENEIGGPVELGFYRLSPKLDS